MILAIAFLSIFGIVASAGLLLFYREDLMDRLQKVVAEPRSQTSWIRRAYGLRQRQSTVAKITKPFQDVLPRSAAETSIIQKRLARAGYRHPQALNVFYGAKVLAPIVLSTMATVSGAYELGPFFIYGVCVGLGFLFPDFWLGNRITNRQTKIKLGLPEALDMLVICTEAGLGLDQAIQRVGEELKISQPEIRDELGLIGLEQKAGRRRDEALRGFADRADLPTVRALVTTMIQADQFGTSVVRTLRVYSDTLRMQRRHDAEELAAKTTVKLVFPLVFCIFPSIFLVALGPSAISLWEGMEKAFG